MDYSSADFMRFSVQELADMLSEKLSENMSEGKDVSSVKLHGLVDGRMFEMDVVMREVDSGMNNDGVYLLDTDGFLDFMEALKEHYEEVDSDGVE